MSSHDPMYGRMHAEAKRLFKAVRKEDPTAIAIIRNAFPEAAPDDDQDLVIWVTLMRAQHAYAVQQGAKSWSDLREKAKMEWRAHSNE